MGEDLKAGGVNFAFGYFCLTLCSSLSVAELRNGNVCFEIHFVFSEPTANKVDGL